MQEDFKCSFCRQNFDSSERKPYRVCSNNHSVFVCGPCYDSIRDHKLQSICP